METCVWRERERDRSFVGCCLMKISHLAEKEKVEYIVLYTSYFSKQDKLMKINHSNKSLIFVMSALSLAGSFY